MHIVFLCFVHLDPKDQENPYVAKVEPRKVLARAEKDIWMSVLTPQHFLFQKRESQIHRYIKKLLGIAGCMMGVVSHSSMCQVTTSPLSSWGEPVPSCYLPTYLLATMVGRRRHMGCPVGLSQGLQVLRQLWVHHPKPALRHRPLSVLQQHQRS